MASVYPGALPTFTTKEDNVDVYAASHINKLQEDLVAIATELGTDPAATSTDLKTRLAVSIGDDGAIRKGTSFPASPIDGQAFYRTDEDAFYIYNGTSWLSTTNLTNTAFTFAIGGDYAVASFALESTITPGSATIKYPIWAVNGDSSDVVIIRGKYKKISGVNTITCYASIWQSSSSTPRRAHVRVDIGGQVGTGTGTDGQLTPEIKTFTVDITSLSAGTTYDLKITLRHFDNGSSQAYMGWITGIAS